MSFKNTILEIRFVVNELTESKKTNMNTKRFLKNLIGLLFIAIVSCNDSLEENLIPIESLNSNKFFITNTVSLDQIPEIQTFFESKTKNDIFIAKGEDEPIFNTDKIIEMIDTDENRNYSFSFTMSDTPKYIFYNLIIGVNSNVKTTPIVLKYTIAPEHYDEWVESGLNFANFTGTIDQHLYTDYFKNGLFSKEECSEHDANGDPISCNTEVVTDGTIGGGGSTSSGGSGGAGTSSGCEYNSYLRVCGGNQQYTVHAGGANCGGDGGGSYWVLEVTCPDGGAQSNKSSSKLIDCDSCNSGPSGGVGVNATPPPPSCKSFSYVNTASNWQEASVINIRFNIVLIEIVAGVRVKKVIPIIFPNPVRFGVPKQFKNGTRISAGLAAELSAQAIEDSIDDVISTYNNLVVSSTDVIRNQFKERLKHNHRERTNGGRVNFNDLLVDLTPTQYQTSAIITDGCD